MPGGIKPSKSVFKFLVAYMRPDICAFIQSLSNIYLNFLRYIRELSVCSPTLPI